MKTTDSSVASPAWSRSSDVLGGELVFTATRVPVRSLFDHLEAGDSLDDFLEGFPSVTRNQAVTALEQRGQPPQPGDFASEPHPKGEEHETDGVVIVFENLPIELRAIPPAPELFKHVGVFRYRPRHIGNRIVAQKAEFFYIPEPNVAYIRDITSIVVPKARKAAIQDQLLQLGVSHASVYPGLDGLC